MAAGEGDARRRRQNQATDRTGSHRSGTRNARRRSAESGGNHLRSDPAARAPDAGGGTEARQQTGWRRAVPQRRGHGGGRRRNRFTLDWNSGRENDGRGARASHQTRERAIAPRNRAIRSSRGGLERGTSLESGPAGSESANRLVHLPRSHRCRQDRDGPRPRRVSVR